MRFFSKKTIALMFICVFCLTLAFSFEQTSGLEFRMQTDFFSGVEGDKTLVDLIIWLYNNVLLPLALIVAFASIVFVGFKYIVSGSNPDKRRKSLEQVKKIFIGAVVVLTSVLILNFINNDIANLENTFVGGVNETECNNPPCIDSPDISLKSTAFGGEGVGQGIEYTQPEYLWKRSWENMTETDKENFDSWREYVTECSQKSDDKEKDECFSNKYIALLKKHPDFNLGTTFLVQKENDTIKPSCAAMCVYRDYWIEGVTEGATEEGDDIEIQKKRKRRYR